MNTKTEALSVLHAGFIVEPSSGVLQQMEFEMILAERASVPWTSALFSRLRGRSSVSIGANRYFSVNKFLTRLNYYLWLRKRMADYDVLLLRYSLADPVQWLFLLSITKPVYLVHHTIEEHQFRALPGVMGMMKKFIECRVGPKCLRLANGSVAVTNEIGRYERRRFPCPDDYPIFIYPNGVLMDQANSQEFACTLGSKIDGHIHLLFVASLFTSWQGLDLLLDSIENSESVFTLHLVGEVYEADLVRCCNDNRVVLHGQLDSAEMRKIEQICSVAVGSLALHRKSLNEACALKVRQYLHAGLPVYSSHKDVFPDEFPFYRIGAVDIDLVLDYAREMLNTSRCTVRAQATPYIDKKRLWENLYQSINIDYKRRCPEMAIKVSERVVGS